MRKYVAIAWTAFFLAIFYLIPHRDGVHDKQIFLLMFSLFCAFGICGVILTRHLKENQIICKIMLWNEKLTKKADGLFSHRKLFLLCWLLLTVCWIPAYLAWFPGIFGYDAPIQAAQFFGDEMISSHHPLCHTWMLGLFLKMGEVLQNYNTGFAVYIAVQMLFVTGALAYLFLFLQKRKVPIPFILIGFIWVVVNPFLQILTFNATKDILFGAFMLLFTVCFWELIEPIEPLKKWSYIQVFLSGFLMCLFRNQGIYIILVLALICLVFKLKSWKIYGSMAGIIVAYIVFCLICTNVFKIPQGDKKEMLSVPMQQIAAAAYYYLEDGERTLTEEQFQIIEKIIPEKYIRKWWIITADPVKEGFVTEELEKDFFRHLVNYIQIGIQNPYLYVSTFYFMILPYWDMSKNRFLEQIYEYTFPELNSWGIEERSLLKPYQSFFKDRIESNNIPFFIQPAVCLWCMVILTGIAFGRKNKMLFIEEITPVLYFGTVILGPMALIRYMYPLLLTVPLFFCMSLRALGDLKESLK